MEREERGSMRGEKRRGSGFWRTARACVRAALLCGLALVADAALGQSDLEATLERLGSPERADVKSAIAALGELDDPAALPALRALAERRLAVGADGRLFATGADGTPAPLTRGDAPGPAAEELREAAINNAVRRVLSAVIAQLELQSSDPAVRLQAAQALGERSEDASTAALERALARESDPAVRDLLRLTLAQLGLASPDPAARIAALEAIGDSGDLSLRTRVEELVREDSPGTFAEPDPAVRAAAAAVLARFDRSRLLAESAQHLFYGLSLGSVLLLAALGLAITFGLMRVINMAHGEMLMLGAYTTFTVQQLFERFLPGAFDLYVLAAIPAAFAVTGGIGMLLERCVIRFLYGRPLETLLTTWGISLILIQSVRLTFGAANVAVANPSWLSGGIEVSSGAVLPYARIATVLFAAGVVTLIGVLLQRTRLGLQVRAVTQNREMAASMGIATAKVDMWTFGLGCGIAGLGGVALSQLGNVGPELGQGYIVDSFMVVVLGGVGSLAGTIWGALALGIVNKVLEPAAGAVLGKIAVLVVVILFIQRRPEGIFALRGRAAEA
jgi:urea transport system permease protein